MFSGGKEREYNTVKSTYKENTMSNKHMKAFEAFSTEAQYG